MKQRKIGRPTIGKASSFTMLLRDGERAKLEALAAAMGVTQSDWIRLAIRRAKLEEEKKS